MSENARVEPKQAQSINTRGMVCPYPSFETIKAYSLLQPGQALHVLGEDDEVLDSVLRTLAFRGIRYDLSKEGPQWTVRVVKIVTP